MSETLGGYLKPGEIKLVGRFSPPLKMFKVLLSVKEFVWIRDAFSGFIYTRANVLCNLLYTKRKQ